MGFHHFSYCHGVALHAALLMVTGIVTAGHSAAGAGLPSSSGMRSRVIPQIGHSPGLSEV